MKGIVQTSLDATRSSSSLLDNRELFNFLTLSYVYMGGAQFVHTDVAKYFFCICMYNIFYLLCLCVWLL